MVLLLLVNYIVKDFLALCVRKFKKNTYGFELKLKYFMLFWIQLICNLSLNAKTALNVKV